MARSVPSLHPALQRLLWVAHAALFFQSGLQFTTWLLAPADFAGGSAWAWVAAFPLLLIGFFPVQRRLGCASGHCTAPRGSRRDDDDRYTGGMPG